MSTAARSTAWRVVVLIAVLCALVASVGAQEAAPDVRQIAAIPVRQGGLLTYVAGGDFLIVSDAELLQLFDLTDPSTPESVASLSLDQPPLALAATSDFALAAVPTNARTDELVIIAQDPYSRIGFSAINFVTIPKNPRAVILSPDLRWALIPGATDYITLALADADNIESSAFIPTGDAPVIGAALSNDQAFLIRQGRSEIELRPLTTDRTAQTRPRTIPLDAQPTAIALNAAGDLGAVALANGQIILFDPATLTVQGTVAVADGPVAALHFLTLDDGEYLALISRDQAALTLVDVSASDGNVQPGRVGLNGATSILGVATHNGYLAVAAGNSVRIFQAAQ